MTITADTPLDLFDIATAIVSPPTIVHRDSPRTRRTDPTTSHQAGDVSQRTLRDTKARVLFVLAKAGKGVTGSEVNDLYLFTTARLDWPRCAFDTPRKRLAELVADGYAEVTGTRTAFGRGQSAIESIYALTDKGRKVVTPGFAR